MARNSKRRSEEYDDAEIEEGDDGARITTQGRKKSKRSRKVVQVMSNSDQTDADRRALRCQQRTLRTALERGGEVSEQLADASSNQFDKVRGDNNELWKEVKYTREAVLDGEVVQEISTRAARQVDKLINVSVLQINVGKLTVISLCCLKVSF